MTDITCPAFGPIGIAIGVIGGVGKIVFKQLEKKLEELEKKGSFLNNLFSLITDVVTKTTNLTENYEKLRKFILEARKKHKFFNKICSTLEKLTKKKEKIISSLNEKYKNITETPTSNQEKEMDDLKKAIIELGKHPNMDIVLATNEFTKSKNIEL